MRKCHSSVTYYIYDKCYSPMTCHKNKQILHLDSDQLIQNSNALCLFMYYKHTSHMHMEMLMPIE